jgi:hypothetical protein
MPHESGHIDWAALGKLSIAELRALYAGQGAQVQPAPDTVTLDPSLAPIRPATMPRSASETPVFGQPGAPNTFSPPVDLAVGAYKGLEIMSRRLKGDVEAQFRFFIGQGDTPFEAKKRTREFFANLPERLKGQQPIAGALAGGLVTSGVSSPPVSLEDMSLLDAILSGIAPGIIPSAPLSAAVRQGRIATKGALAGTRVIPLRGGPGQPIPSGAVTRDVRQLFPERFLPDTTRNPILPITPMKSLVPPVPFQSEVRQIPRQLPAVSRDVREIFPEGIPTLSTPRHYRPAGVPPSTNIPGTASRKALPATRIVEVQQPRIINNLELLMQAEKPLPGLKLNDDTKDELFNFIRRFGDDPLQQPIDPAIGRFEISPLTGERQFVIGSYFSAVGRKKTYLKFNPESQTYRVELQLGDEIPGRPGTVPKAGSTTAQLKTPQLNKMKADLGEINRAITLEPIGSPKYKSLIARRNALENRILVTENTEASKLGISSRGPSPATLEEIEEFGKVNDRLYGAELRQRELGVEAPVSDRPSLRATQQPPVSPLSSDFGRGGTQVFEQPTAPTARPLDEIFASEVTTRKGKLVGIEGEVAEEIVYAEAARPLESSLIRYSDDELAFIEMVLNDKRRTLWYESGGRGSPDLLAVRRKQYKVQEIIRVRKALDKDAPTPAPVLPAVREVAEDAPAVRGMHNIGIEAQASTKITSPPPQVPVSARPSPPPPRGQQRFLTELQDFQTTMDVAFEPNMFRRIAERLADTPVVGKIIRLGNPSGVARSPVERATITRLQLRDEAQNRVNVAMTHPRTIGTQDELFGRTNASTGLLEDGALAGRSVNEIAENPTRFSSQLNSQQREWLKRMAEVEDEILPIYNRNNISITELDGGEVERYAGRIVVQKLTPEGDLIQAAFIGEGPARVGGKTGGRKARTFSTVEKAQSEGFVYAPYEEALPAKARAAYNTVADKRTTDFILENIPKGIQTRIGRGRVSDREFIESNSEVLRNRFFKGTGAREFVDDLDRMLATPTANATLRKIGRLNQPQRLLALAGDASPFMIQLQTALYKHPVSIFKSGGVFVRQLGTALFNPDSARRYRANMLSNNRELLNRNPEVLINSTQEATEALGQQGILSPKGRVGKALTTTRVLPAFQQAYESTMDAAGIFLLKGLEHQAVKNPQNRSVVAQYINKMRGMTSSARVGVSPNQREAEALLLLASRYRRAVASLHADIFQGGLRGDLARKAYLNLFIGSVMTFGALTIALGVKGGKTPSQIKDDFLKGMNPADSRFLLYRTGRGLIGPGGKMISDIRMLGRIMTNPTDFADFDEFQSNPGVRWLRSQSAAIPQAATTILTGRDYLGEPFTNDIVGDPIETLKSFGKLLGTNVIPIWVQALAFDGGTILERLQGGVGDFLGLRAFPSGAVDILRDDSLRLFGRKYSDLNEPFERTLVRFGSSQTERLLKIQKQSAERGFPLSEYYASLDTIEVKRIERLINERDNLGNRWSNINSINNFSSGRRLQAGLDREFEENDVNDPDPNRRALAQYWVAVNSARNEAGNFPPPDPVTGITAVDKALEKVQPNWTPDQNEYVLRNTNTRPLPINPETREVPNVGQATKDAYKASHEARVRYLQSIGKDDLIPLLTQYTFVQPIPVTQ